MALDLGCLEASHYQALITGKSDVIDQYEFRRRKDCFVFAYGLPETSPNLHAVRGTLSWMPLGYPCEYIYKFLCLYEAVPDHLGHLVDVLC